jgi:hypothetical protein
VVETSPNPVYRTGARRLDAPAPLRLWHLASFDAPTVAVVWTLAFGWAAGVRLPGWIPVLMALVAWAVYLGDRLLDARAALRRGNLGLLRERHLFHWRHRRIFVPLGLAATAAAACIVVALMPAVARERDSVLGAAAVAYFAGVHSRRSLVPAFLAPLFSKELLVGVLFTAACALPALGRTDTRTIWPLAAALVFFVLLAWLNCHSIELWESSNPIRRPFPAAISLVLLGLILSAALAHAQPRLAALVLAGSVSSLLLALLDHHRDRLTPVALRAAADLVLLTPVAVLFR